ncbi:primosomal protein N', partial [Myxococcota bacterium]|nr:primosomal protein N' [Myxococcota bacterium]
MTDSFTLSPHGKRSGVRVVVALPLPIFDRYTYHLAPGQTAREGQRVVVPLRGRRLTGYVVGTDTAYKGKTTAVDHVLDNTPLFGPPLLDALRWASHYYQHPLGEVLKASHPPLEETFEKQRFFLKEYNPDLLVEPFRSLTTCMKEGKGYVHSTLRKFGLSALQIRRGVELGILTQELVMEQRGPAGKVRAVVSLSVEPSASQLEWLNRSTKRESLYRELLDSILPLTLSSPQLAGKSTQAYLRDFAKQGLLELGQVVATDSSHDWHLVDNRPPPEKLSAEQEMVLETLTAQPEGFEVFLLQGVTGSGKTEVYIRKIQQILARGLTALVVVPEISLTPQLSARFRGRFGDLVSILHSGLTAYERAIEWRRVQEGRVSIVVGARSAIFAPLSNLGLIVVDEEHDQSYKQEEGFRYNARDFAIVRAKHEQCPIILGSATPSLESRWNAETGKYQHLIMSSRPTPSPLPRIEIVDLRVHQQEDLFTARLVTAMGEALARKEQIILFLNRRGFQGRLQCDACGEVLMCPRCSVSLTLHRKQGRALCHYCG